MEKQIIKKALIFDPYLDTLGGGERYTLSFAKVLVDNGYSVEVAWPYFQTITEAGQRFNLDFSGISINSEAFNVFTKGNIYNKYLTTRNYDLIFWVSDGSLPFLFAKKNLVHFQVPFKKVKGAILKSFLIHKYIYNSKFTQSILENSLPKSKGVVIYPPVDIEKFKPSKKENLIIGVGRFDAPLNNKRQDVLIEAFKAFHEKEPNYELVLLGGLLGDDSKIDHLKIQAQGLPVDFITNPDFETLKSYYAKAKFFWHAAGYGVNEENEPEKVEHFGMTTVEAVAAGCIPVVIAKGGQKEIITNPELLCNDPNDISQNTISQISNPITPTINLKAFSFENFTTQIKQII